MTQLAITVKDNKNLFSNYYLDNQIEKQLEQRFLGPIFKILGHTIEVNESTDQGEFPDYAFFPDSAGKDEKDRRRTVEKSLNSLVRDESGFDALASALAKNRKKLKVGYDPTRREPKEKLQTEFNTSVGKLAPLLKKIEATDGLIDQIVYKLYGLTEDEIKIVEESISGGKDL